MPATNSEIPDSPITDFLSAMVKLLAGLHMHIYIYISYTCCCFFGGVGVGCFAERGLESCKR